MWGKPRLRGFRSAMEGGALGDLVVVRKGLKVAAQRFTALPRFTDDQLRRLAAAMEYVEFEGGTQIIVQGTLHDLDVVVAQRSARTERTFK